MAELLPQIDRITANIIALSEMTSAAEVGHTRISFSDEDLRARAYVEGLMALEANLDVNIDAAGNIVGRRQGESALPAIIIGSHIDTVKGGGRFDGIAGVIAGLEVARIFEERQVKNTHPLEVIVFTAEEPSPFGISTVGSRAMTGKLPAELLTSLRDPDGRTLADVRIDGAGDAAVLHSASLGRVVDDVARCSR